MSDFDVYCAGEEVTPGLGITYVYTSTPLGKLRMTEDEAEDLGRKLLAAAEYNRSLEDEE